MERCHPNQAMVERVCVCVYVCVRVTMCTCVRACMWSMVYGLFLEKVKAFLGKGIGNPIVCFTLTGPSS